MIIFISNIALIIFSFFFFPSPTFAQENKFYNVNLLYDKGKIDLKNIAVLPGEISQVAQEGEYRFELASLAGTILYSNRFEVPLSIHGEEIDPATGGFVSRTITQDQANIVVNVPYFPNGKEIDIYDPENKKILTIPVQHFAEITPSPTPVFKPALAENNGGGNILLYIGLGALGFGVAYAVYLKFKKPPNQIQ